MPDFPPIAEHGLIGDLQTAALVATDGTVDWFCAPRFDSPSVFGALLDAGRGGHLITRPATEAFTAKQLYLPDSAVLVTRFMTDTGVGEIVDFMPISDSTTATDRHRLVRLVRCVRGEMTFAVHIAPRFGYGRDPFRTRATDQAVLFETDKEALTVRLIREPFEEPGRSWVDSDGDVRAELQLRAGQRRGLVLEIGPAAPLTQFPLTEALRLLDETVDFWESWLSGCTYQGRWREMVHRAAITIKLMTYAPTGGLVAAPTAALPEQVGGERNWDYRYTWVRDASFSVYSLLSLGFSDEAAALGRWLRDRVFEQAEKDPTGPLQIMYRVDGSSDLIEETLPHWSGYRGSSPVRIGNGAAGQLQLDIYGEAMDSIYVGQRHGIVPGHEGWQAIRHMLDWVAANWAQPEEGIWETRGGRQDFTYGRLMCWVALDRGLRIAAEHGRPAPLDEWRRQRDAIYTEIMERGWSPARQAFRQHYDTNVLDSSLLRMPTVGFVTPHDPRWLSTLRAMESELVTDSLVYRYDPAASPDGLRGSEGTFSLCTFAYVTALAGAGELDKARVTFEKMLTYANHLGLYSEEIGLTGEQLGNFPQAFTHLSLIDAAVTLDRQLDRYPRAAARRHTVLPPSPGA
ncbi:GH15 family glucan-1,4-alpha-glucosidase [Actinoplanes octamycinicus]|uniref:GH15 family glucan-1,4-alpha-glucosidase n=1 Tax=Actinoplanes octamycinicus TaxID=135948 RepID=A0A7W7GYM8_9ACTN|nr:glycoside hydrolase family 15 protein [Actinoplanes octamycinicus]MBB4740710.1 GH15 family glucan-1,4-alpha-glucosidase [Actinoplanes octamycinicus]GIE61754.1 glucoamylase [Actinoplanes octamycinicus]